MLLSIRYYLIQTLDSKDDIFNPRLEFVLNCATTRQAASNALAKRDMSRWDPGDQNDHDIDDDRDYDDADNDYNVDILHS